MESDFLKKLNDAVNGNAEVDKDKINYLNNLVSKSENIEMDIKTNPNKLRELSDKLIEKPKDDIENFDWEKFESFDINLNEMTNPSIMNNLADEKVFSLFTDLSNSLYEFYTIKNDYVLLITKLWNKLNNMNSNQVIVNEIEQLKLKYELLNEIINKKDE